MPAVSPGPSNVTTSILVPAALVGIPTGGLRAGDFAYTSATNQYWSFLPASVAPPSPTVYYADCALAGLYAGRWHLFVGGGGGGGAPLITEYFTAAPAQTAFVLGTLPSGAVVMMVNGVAYPEGVSWSISGVNVTWNDVPFPLLGDTVTFIYN